MWGESIRSRETGVSKITHHERGKTCITTKMLIISPIRKNKERGQEIIERGANGEETSWGTQTRTYKTWPYAEDATAKTCKEIEARNEIQEPPGGEGDIPWGGRRVVEIVDRDVNG